MQNSLIINVRGELRWHRRLVSDVTTLALWAAWLWLCRPLFGAVATLCGSRVGSHYATGSYAMSCTPATIEFSAMLLAGTSVILLLWNQVTARQALRPRLTALPDYAGHFGLSAQDILRSRECSVCVVHHDESGRIVRIQDRSPTLSASC
jgi:poly-beta-1,6-N-acetyl-D-glucosamine biosynthesis protein PgaD